MSYSKEQQYHQIWKQLITEGKLLPEYKLLKSKKYTNPRGYLPYKEVIQLMSSQILNGYKYPWDLITTDFATHTATTINTQIASTKAPAYWLSQSLLESFLHTDLPNWICEMQRPIPMAILMLPRGIIHSPDGESINYVAFRHTKAFENPPTINFNHQKIITEVKSYDYVTWNTVTQSGTVYASCIGLQMSAEGELDHGQHNFGGYEQLGIEIDEKAENNFLRTVDKILLQTLLLMQIRPNIVSTAIEEITTHSSGLGFLTSKKQVPQSTWSPNWIGKDYVAKKVNTYIKEDNSSVVFSGLHGESLSASWKSLGEAKPHPKISAKIPPVEARSSQRQPHWRRGHFRRIVVGSKTENQRQWHWFEPVLVNANLSN